MRLDNLGLAEKLAPSLKADYVAPTSVTEMALARIWAEVLGLERVGVEDNFFALGGDSLRATQAISRVAVAFQIELPVTVMFREPRIAEQARLIEEKLIEEIAALTDEEARRLTR